MMENARNTHTHRTPYPLVATNVCVRSRVCVRMKKKGRERALDVDGLQMQTNDGRMTIPVIVRPQPPTSTTTPPPSGNTSVRVCIGARAIHQRTVERGGVPSVTSVWEGRRR